MPVIAMIHFLPTADRYSSSGHHRRRRVGPLTTGVGAVVRSCCVATTPRKLAVPVLTSGNWSYEFAMAPITDFVNRLTSVAYAFVVWSGPSSSRLRHIGPNVLRTSV